MHNADYVGRYSGTQVRTGVVDQDVDSGLLRVELFCALANRLEAGQIQAVDDRPVAGFTPSEVYIQGDYLLCALI
jgi:hypothetical protein